MKQKVRANVINDIANAFKTISETLFKFFDKFDDYGIEVTKKEQIDNGGVKMWCKYDDIDFGLIVSPILDENQKSTGKSNVLVRCNKKGHKFENINDFDIDKQVIELLKKEIGLGAESDSDDGSVNSSRKLQVTLQRITSATSCAINLTSINANFDSIGANELLNTVLDNEDFLSTVTENPTSFEITDCGDCINVQTIDGFSTSDVFHNLLSKAVKLWGMLSVIHWNAHGDDFSDLHRMTDTYRYRIMNDIDMFGELIVELGGAAKNPVLLPREDITPAFNADYSDTTSFKSALSMIRDMISEYIESLELYYVNFSYDIQHEMNCRIRDWKRERDYFIKQCLK